MATAVSRARCSAWSDPSFYGVLLGNAFTLVVAQVADWAAGPLLWVYWGQSVAIGITNSIRIRRLGALPPAGAGPTPGPAPGSATFLARMFAVSYGSFHLLYLAFLLQAHLGGGLAAGDIPWVAVSVGAFAVAHVYSLARNRERDFRDRRPKLAVLMFYPYLRILPMHLAIIYGARQPDAVLPLVILLKTAADAGMHLVEHAFFQRQE